MFNLIVSGRLTGREGLLPRGRVVQYTAEHLMEKFCPEGQLSIDAVVNFPTVLINEGRNDEPVTIGKIIRIEDVGREVRFDYQESHALPSLFNRDLFRLKDELEIDDWEFGTNHWAIKEVDIFEVLYREQMGSSPQPTVFQISRNPVNEDRVSLMMPFGGFSAVHVALREVVEGEGWECRRADDIWDHDHVLQDIVELIYTSKVVICDLTGKNANVFYETGLAHMMGKKTILITQSRGDVPFDLQHLRHVQYHPNTQGLEELKAEILPRLVDLMSRS